LGFGTDSLRATILPGSSSNRGIIVRDNEPGTFLTIFQIGNGTRTNGGRDLLLGSNFTASTTAQAFTKLELSGTYTELSGGGICRGLYINTTIGATNNYRAIEWTNNNGWGLYGSGTSNNFLAGSLGIGTTSLTGMNLYVNKNIINRAGGNGFGIANESVIQSSVTNLALLYQSFVSTQNTNFALTNIRHYSTESATTFANVTAGGSVTNQYGYWADSSLTGATNNFGFYGNIASGTGRWNLYMNGTAANYMAGNLLLGSTTDSGERLQVTGTAKITSKLSMGAGTTSAAQINLASSTAPTSPSNGDIWFDGTDIKMRIGGVTKTFTLL